MTVTWMVGCQVMPRLWGAGEAVAERLQKWFPEWHWIILNEEFVSLGQMLGRQKPTEGSTVCGHVVER